MYAYIGNLSSVFNLKRVQLLFTPGKIGNYQLGLVESDILLFVEMSPGSKFDRMPDF